ncbi:Blp family class II bacteriocin [Bacillus vallismortis]|uniref:Blp family class II bacteriocin n=1 Tax=Bacillus vallismortis TaxID=72361 RepID=UPI003B9832B3
MVNISIDELEKIDGGNWQKQVLGVGLSVADGAAIGGLFGGPVGAFVGAHYGAIAYTTGYAIDKAKNR